MVTVYFCRIMMRRYQLSVTIIVSLGSDCLVLWGWYRGVGTEIITW